MAVNVRVVHESSRKLYSDINKFPIVRLEVRGSIYVRKYKDRYIVQHDAAVSYLRSNLPFVSMDWHTYGVNYYLEQT